MAVRTLIVVPATAKRGEVIEVRATIAHPMETGYRADAEGRVVPRDIIRRFSCDWDGERVFEAELHPAVAANPMVAFSVTALASGTLTLRWRGDGGFEHAETRTVTVT